MISGRLDLSKMRDCQQFKEDGVELSTTSNEVSKLFDSVVFQIFGCFDATEVNGIAGAVSRIVEIDPLFPMVKLLTLQPTIKDFNNEMAKLKTELKSHYEGTMSSRRWTSFERRHMQALIYKLEGNTDLASEVWMDQLAKSPMDIFSLTQLTCYNIIRGSTSNLAFTSRYTRQNMKPDNVYYPFVLGYEAFGLEEYGQLDKAFSLAHESLSMYPWNSWATHSIAHVYESWGRSMDGIKFMNDTRKDWTEGSHLSCHNNWHISLFQLAEGNILAALETFDTEILPRVKNQCTYFNVSDAVALLTRIDLEKLSLQNTNADLTERWNSLMSAAADITGSSTGMNFYDAILAMAMTGSHRPQLLKNTLQNLSEWVSTFESRVYEDWEIDIHSKPYAFGRMVSDRYITRKTALIPFVQGLIHFENKDYDLSVESLFPYRHQFRHLGGSKAQNETFSRLVATSLMMAGGSENISRLKLLLSEIQDQRTTCSYTDKMMTKIFDIQSLL